MYGYEKPRRRMLFLELVAWAITRIEGISTQAEAKAFAEELTRNREAVWGAHPWRHAAYGASAFFAHVRDLANAFAHSHYPDVEYANRQRQPLDA